MEPDFTGYATKVGLKCSDGRTIMKDAFAHMDGKTVPLVWQHSKNDPTNVLGHAKLSAREDGTYCEAFFNDTSKGKHAKTLVEHGDITMLSIFANQLVERSKQVFHGVIHEVSLVLAGANPGAKIENVTIRHSDGDVEELADEVVITTGLEFEHAGEEDDSSDSEDDGLDLEKIYDSMTEEQKDAVQIMVGAAVEAASSEDSDDSEESAEQSATNNTEDALNHQEGSENMTANLFDQSDKDSGGSTKTLTHAEKAAIFQAAQQGGSLMHAMQDAVLEHGINNLELLFPEAKELNNTPEWDKRRTEWVASVLNGTRKTPFAKVRTTHADITMDEARAKGYIKGNMKKEEFFSVARRETGPTTIYKKQGMHRDDILDISDFDVVAWLWGEMRLMIEEEIARAILIGDGREVDDEDKINEEKIRPIAKEHELYATKVYVPEDSSPIDIVDALLTQRSHYRGTGSPTFYTTEPFLTRMLLARDSLGRRYWKTVDELAAELRVSSIVPVEVMESDDSLYGIMVNLSDYNVGTNKGGELTTFDDFDIDYNKYKYLIETRLSGALVKLKSALVVVPTASTNELAVPEEPTFDGSSITIPTVTGVEYQVDGVAVTTSVAVADGESVTVVAVPTTGYYFATSADDEWTFLGEA